MSNRNNEVMAFLTRYPPEVRDLVHALRRLIRDTIPEVHESLDLPAKIIAYGFGTGYSDMICTIIPSQKGVKLGIVRGAEMADPDGLMEGTGKRHRHVVLTTLSDLEKPGLKPLLVAAVADWKAKSKTG
jgi:hypothetical protein